MQASSSIVGNKKVTIIGGVIVSVSLAVVLIYMASVYYFPELSLDSLLSAIGLNVSDVIGIAFFIGFLVVLYLLGKGGESKEGS